MVGIALAFLDKNSFGSFLTQNLTGFDYVLNIIVTITISVSVIATVISGIDYLKGSRELFKGSK